jgi:hypothetical protein
VAEQYWQPLWSKLLKGSRKERTHFAPSTGPPHRSLPSSLKVHYHLQNVGMEYDRTLFGMKLADCRNLAKVGEIRALLKRWESQD